MRLWEFRVPVTFSGLEAWSQLLWMWLALFTDLNNVLSESALNDFLNKVCSYQSVPLRCVAATSAVHQWELCTLRRRELNTAIGEVCTHWF